MKLMVIQCCLNNAHHSVSFADIDNCTFLCDGYRIPGFRVHLQRQGIGAANIPEALITAFRVTHCGTAFNLTPDQGRQRAVASGLRCLHGHLATADLRGTLASYWVSKALNIPTGPCIVRIKQLCRDLAADVSLVRATLPLAKPLSAPASSSTHDNHANIDVQAILIRNAELVRLNHRLSRALNEALPSAANSTPKQHNM